MMWQHPRDGVSMVERGLFLLLSLCLALWAAASAAAPQFLLPKSGLAPEELAVIVNDGDPLSRRIAEYYQMRRHIPDTNMIHVRFPVEGAALSREAFARIKAEVDRKTPDFVQAYALTWAAPYRVDCMSITTAFAAGFDETYCAQGCAATRKSPYFNSPSLAPFRDHHLRPTMALAGKNFEEVKALIDRGVAADETNPDGTAYLLNTGDHARNVRAAIYPALVKRKSELVEMQVIDGDYIKDKQDVLFYFTGALSVPALETLRFLPGAIADHLTSTGGRLTDSEQMSSLRWLEAGATGSYGTVVEPCNHPGKFPNPALAIFWYARGESLIEAYWKSVAMPGQGIFIGEPLARPFGGYSLTQRGNEFVLHTRVLTPGVYMVSSAPSEVGPFHREPGELIISRAGKNEIRLGNLKQPLYRLTRIR